MNFNFHMAEEAEYRDGPRLWDADPTVCCAAAQLGACRHSEDAAFEAQMAEEEALAADADAFLDAYAAPATTSTIEPF